MSPTPHRQESRRRRMDRYDYGAFGVLLLFAFAGVLSIARTGPTVDEPNHLTRGVALWQTGDPRLSFAHPPLANALTAIPAMLGRIGN